MNIQSYFSAILISALTFGAIQPASAQDRRATLLQALGMRNVGPGVIQKVRTDTNRYELTNLDRNGAANVLIAVSYMTRDGLVRSNCRVQIGAGQTHIVHGAVVEILSVQLEVFAPMTGYMR